MSYTNFPNGITSFGMPITGMPYGMKNESRIWFVDQEDGSDGNNGREPSSALKYISSAITKATNYDVIYCLPQGYTTMNDPTPFREVDTNLTSNIPSNIFVFLIPIPTFHSLIIHQLILFVVHLGIGESKVPSLSRGYRDLGSAL